MCTVHIKRKFLKSPVTEWKWEISLMILWAYESKYTLIKVRTYFEIPPKQSPASHFPVQVAFSPLHYEQNRPSKLNPLSWKSFETDQILSSLMPCNEFTNQIPICWKDVFQNFDSTINIHNFQNQMIRISYHLDMLVSPAASIIYHQVHGVHLDIPPHFSPAHQKWIMLVYIIIPCLHSSKTIIVCAKPQNPRSIKHQHWVHIDFILIQSHQTTPLNAYYRTQDCNCNLLMFLHFRAARSKRMKSMWVESMLNESLPRCWWVSAENIFDSQGYVSTLTQHWFHIDSMTLNHTLNAEYQRTVKLWSFDLSRFYSCKI